MHDTCLSYCSTDVKGCHNQGSVYMKALILGFIYSFIELLHYHHGDRSQAWCWSNG